MPIKGDEELTAAIEMARQRWELDKVDDATRKRSVQAFHVSFSIVIISQQAFTSYDTTVRTVRLAVCLTTTFTLMGDLFSYFLKLCVCRAV